MPLLLKMEIAGVNFALSGDESVLLHDMEPVYKPFLKKPDEVSDFMEFSIFLELNHMPETDNFTKIFDSGQSWSMFRHNGEYCLAFTPPGCKQPLWLAKINSDFTGATVYCGEGLLIDDNGTVKVSNPVVYPLDQILLMYILAQRKGLLVHAAGLVVKGKSFIFPGRSGAGKSEIARHLGIINDLEFLSDDRVVVRKTGGHFRAYGTPWPGEGGNAVNKSGALSGIFFVRQGSANMIEDMAPQKALERLFSVSSIPWYDKEVLPEMLLFCEDLITRVPAYEISFTPNAEVADVWKTFIS